MIMKIKDSDVKIMVAVITFIIPKTLDKKRERCPCAGCNDKQLLSKLH